MNQFNLTLQPPPQNLDAPRRYKVVDRIFCIWLPTQAIGQHSRDHVKILICGLAYTINLIFSVLCICFHLVHIGSSSGVSELMRMKSSVGGYDLEVLRTTIVRLFTGSAWPIVATVLPTITGITLIVVAWQTVSHAKRDYEARMLGYMLVRVDWPGRRVHTIDWLTAFVAAPAAIALHGNNRLSSFFSFFFNFFGMFILLRFLVLTVVTSAFSISLSMSQMNALRKSSITASIYIVGIVIGALAWTAAAKKKQSA